MWKTAASSPVTLAENSSHAISASGANGGRMLALHTSASIRPHLGHLAGMADVRPDDVRGASGLLDPLHHGGRGGGVVPVVDDDVETAPAQFEGGRGAYAPSGAGDEGVLLHVLPPGTRP